MSRASWFPMERRVRAVVIAGIGALVAAFLAGCGGGGEPAFPADPAPTVPPVGNPPVVTPPVVTPPVVTPPVVTPPVVTPPVVTPPNPAISVLSPVAVMGLRQPAPLSFSRGIVRETSGSYAFTSGNAILRMSADLQSITPVAGQVRDQSGTTVDGKGDAARFNNPYGITAAPDGTLYVTERYGYVIRRIAPDGTVTTLAGSPGQYGSAEGTGSAARFYLPSGIAMGPDGDLYVADRSNQVIRRVTTAGVVTTYAGIPGSPGYKDDAPNLAKFNHPSGIAVDTDGTVYVADFDGHIRRIARNGNAAGMVSTLAGNGSSTQSSAMDGTGMAATIITPEHLALSDGTLYLRDGAGLVRRIDTATGAVTTMAGTAGTFGSLGTIQPRDGPRGKAGIETGFNGGGLVAMPDGGLLITETNFMLGAVRRVAPDGWVTTLAKSYIYGFSNHTQGTGVLSQLPFGWFPDGSTEGEQGHFTSDVSVAQAPDGSLVVGTRVGVRRISPSGAVTPVIGLSGEATIDGTGSEADGIDVTKTMVVDPTGRIFFSDVSTIRSIDATNTARTIAGSPTFYGDTSGVGQGAADGPGATAKFRSITGLARAASGDLYASDSLNNAIRRIDVSGTVSTFAGVMGERGTADGDRATARFTMPMDLGMGADGTIWLLDSGRGDTPSVRRIAPDGTVSTLPAKGRRLTVDPAGNVYVLTAGGDLAIVDPATGALSTLIPAADQVDMGSDPRIGLDASWAFNAVGVKQLVMMSGRQLIRVTLP